MTAACSVSLRRICNIYYAGRGYDPADTPNILPQLL